MTQTRSQPTQSRQPPYSIEAEQSVLGGLLLDNRSWNDIIDSLGETDFYRADHRLIWRAICELIGANRPCDFVTLTEHLRARTQLDEAGGLSYLGSLANDTPSAANVVAYAEIVRERSVLRSLIAAGVEIAEIGYRPEGRSVGDLIDHAQRAVMSLERRTGTDGPEDIGALSDAYWNAMENRRASGDIGTKTGLIALDNAVGGMQPGDLWIIAGRPSMGKSALAINIADWISREQPVLIFSMEMSRQQVTGRVLGANARIPGHKLRDPRQMSDDESDRLIEAVKAMKARKMVIDDRGGLTVLQVRAKARKLSRKRRLGVIVVDYIQLMTGVGGNRNEEVNDITRGLKSLAKELGCPIIALSQLNRGCESRNPPKPRLSDLRESGGIEQDADVVIGMYRDDYYHQDSAHKGIADAIVLKHRNGATGSVELAWDGPLFLFSDYAGPTAEERRPPQTEKPVRGFGSVGTRKSSQLWRENAA